MGALLHDIVSSACPTPFCLTRRTDGRTIGRSGDRTTVCVEIIAAAFLTAEPYPIVLTHHAKFAGDPITPTMPAGEKDRLAPPLSLVRPYTRCSPPPVPRRPLRYAASRASPGLPARSSDLRLVYPFIASVTRCLLRQPCLGPARSLPVTFASRHSSSGSRHSAMRKKSA